MRDLPQGTTGGQVLSAVLRELLLNYYLKGSASAAADGGFLGSIIFLLLSRTKLYKSEKQD